MKTEPDHLEQDARHRPATRDKLALQFRLELPNDEFGERSQSGKQVPPQVAVDVLCAMEVDSPRAISRVRQLISSEPKDGELSFEDYVERKILRISGGEVHWSNALARSIKKGETPLLEGLRPLLSLSSRPMSIRVTDDARQLLDRLGLPAAQGLAHAQDVDDALRRFANGALAQGWVSARLWERKPKSNGFWWWFWRDALLEHARSPDTHWSRELAESIAEAILREVENESDLVGWEAERDRIIAWRTPTALPGEAVTSDISLPEVPDDIHGRFDWVSLVESWAERELTQPREAMMSAVWTLLRAVERLPADETPHPLIQQLLTLARERPVVVTAIEWALRERPSVIADMLFDRDFSFWALDRLVHWRLASGDDAATRRGEARVLGCVESALPIAASTWLADPTQSGAGLAWLVKKLWEYDDRQNTKNESLARSSRRCLWSTLTGTERTQDSVRSLLESAVEAATTHASVEGYGKPWFCAALEILNESGFRLSETCRQQAHKRLQDVYHRLSKELERVCDLQLPSALAAEFVSGMEKGPVPTVCDLRPIVVAAEKDVAATYRVRDLVRAHIRLLARAIQGWTGGTAPKSLVDALLDAVALGSTKNLSEGRIDAFAPSAEGRDDRQRSLARDVAIALNSLAPDDRDRALPVLERIDEPVALGILIRALRNKDAKRLTDAARAAVQQHPEPQWLSETWSRIEACLSAELYDVAEQLMEQEESTKTRGRVGERPLWRFTTQLRLDFGRHHFDKILTTRVPDELSSPADDTAQRNLQFFQALAEMDRPQGSLPAAEQGFADLAKRYPLVRAFATNLLAVKMRQALQPEEEWPVAMEKRRVLEELLADAESIKRRFDGGGEDADAIDTGNRAMLLMALGRYDKVVTDLGADVALLWSSDQLLSLQIRALVRLGRAEEASSLLERAREEFGDTANLNDARSEVQGGSRPLRSEGLSREMSVDAMRAVFAELRLRSARDQARVFGAAGNTDLPDYLQDLIIRGCTWVTELGPTIRLKTSPGNDLAWEEAINLLLTRLLEGMTQPLEWSVHCEDPGGETPKKWGSRDLAVKKGGSLLATAEAQRIVDGGSWEEDTRQHVAQIRGKSRQCELGFHILWSFVDNPKSVMDKLRKIVEKDATVEQLANPSPVCNGFISTWQGNRMARLRTVHLVVDMGKMRSASSSSDAPVGKEATKANRKPKRKQKAPAKQPATSEFAASKLR